jgi:tetratricopeptide (TPR) repeat protein
MKENYSQTLSWIDKYIDRAPSLGTKAEGCRWKGFYQCWWGDWRAALEETGKLVDVAKEWGSEFWATEADRLKGWIYFDRGDFELSRRCFQRCAKAVQANPREYIPPITSYSAVVPEQVAAVKAALSFALGLVAVKEKDIDSARARLIEIQSVLPSDSGLLHAEILLAEGSPEKAITVCEKAPQWRIPYMSDTGGMLNYNLPFIKDVLSRAYQAKERTDKAIAAYERLIILQPDSKNRRLIHPMYRYRVAELYKQQGRLKQAAGEYKRAAEIWKNADPSLVQAEDARGKIKELKIEN